MKSYIWLILGPSISKCADLVLVLIIICVVFSFVHVYHLLLYVGDRGLYLEGLWCRQSATIGALRIFENFRKLTASKLSINKKHLIRMKQPKLYLRAFAHFFLQFSRFGKKELLQ